MRAVNVAAGRAPARAASRTLRLHVCSKLVLKPIGSGSVAHLEGEQVSRPGPLALRDGTLDVGRLETCAVPILVPTVSSRHAVLTVEGDKLLVYDLDSTNGTMINGQHLKPMNYQHAPVGSEIVFGDEHLAKFILEHVDDDPMSSLDN